MDWLTALVALLLIVFAVGGWRNGLVRRVLELAGLVAALAAASRWSGPLARFLVERQDLDPRAATAAAWALLLLGGLLLTRLAAWGIARLIHWSPLGWLDRWGGAVAGLLAGVLLASVVLVVLCALPGGERLEREVARRPLPRAVYGAAPALASLVLGDDGEWDRLWQRLRRGAERLPGTLTSGGALPVPSRDR